MRIFEPNIIHNPLAWFGVWTPRGWRVHRKRFGRAQRFSVTLSGDGKSTLFAGALRDPSTGKVEWRDDLHLPDDPFTDGGIYPCDPRVEYPPGQPRWAVSHTLLCHPVADHTLHTHEYTWDTESGDLRTHFRKHVELEVARTDDRDGLSVCVSHRPISQTIEGNEHYAINNSAVRGVWDSPDKSGKNFYTHGELEVVRMHNAVYGKPAHAPVVQCHGIWKGESGRNIPRDLPKLGMTGQQYQSTFSRVYETTVQVASDEDVIVDDHFVAEIEKRLGSQFECNRVGYAATGKVAADARGYAGYDPAFDLNDDGIIDERDLSLAREHIGRVLRPNLYRSGYFGGDWISTGVLLAPGHDPGIEVIVDYTWAGGYDAENGVIRLLQSPGPRKPVWVEYFYDAPADPGEDNIRLHLYREL